MLAYRLVLLSVAICGVVGVPFEGGEIVEESWHDIVHTSEWEFGSSSKDTHNLEAGVVGASHIAEPEEPSPRAQPNVELAEGFQLWAILSPRHSPNLEHHLRLSSMRANRAFGRGGSLLNRIKTRIQHTTSLFRPAKQGKIKFGQQ